MGALLFCPSLTRQMFQLVRCRRRQEDAAAAAAPRTGRKSARATLVELSTIGFVAEKYSRPSGTSLLNGSLQDTTEETDDDR